jgi:hypothetical protein
LIIVVGINTLGRGHRKYKLEDIICLPMDAIETEILKHSKDQKIDCHAALGIAKKFSIHPKEVGAKIDGLGIRICHCQLGCFE